MQLMSQMYWKLFLSYSLNITKIQIPMSPCWGMSEDSVSVTMWLLPPRSQDWAKIPEWGQNVLLMLGLLILVSSISYWSSPSPGSFCCSSLRVPLQNGVWVSRSWRPLTTVLLAVVKNSAPMCYFNTLSLSFPLLGTLYKHFKTGEFLHFKELLISSLKEQEKM